MKPIIFFATLIVLLLISPGNLQNNTRTSFAKDKESEIIMPVEEKAAYTPNCGAESDSFRKETELPCGTQNLSHSMANYMSGKLITGVFMIF